MMNSSVLRCSLCSRLRDPSYSPFFFFNDTATTEIYTLSLHDALPILSAAAQIIADDGYILTAARCNDGFPSLQRDRKSTRLNSSHQIISYAVFCFKKKNKRQANVLSVQSTTIGANSVSTHPTPQSVHL